MAPLLIVDTNFLMDLWLGRDDRRTDGQSAAGDLLALAKNGLVEIALFDFVLAEFEGTSRKFLSVMRSKLTSNEFLEPPKNLERISVSLGEDAPYPSFAAIGDQIKELAKLAKDNLFILDKNRTDLVSDFKTQAVAGVRRIPENLKTNHEGMVRCRRGDPPDSPGKGMQDCIIFEYILAFGMENAKQPSPTQTLLFLTKDAHFENNLLDEELKALNIFRRKDFDVLVREIENSQHDL